MVGSTLKKNQHITSAQFSKILSAARSIICHFYEHNRQRDLLLTLPSPWSRYQSRPGVLFQLRCGSPSLAAMFDSLLMHIPFFFVVVYVSVCLLLSFSGQVIKQIALQSLLYYWNISYWKNVNRGAYHLHGKPGNSGWKVKWYTPFHLKHSRNYSLSS